VILICSLHRPHNEASETALCTSCRGPGPGLLEKSFRLVVWEIFQSTSSRPHGKFRVTSSAQLLSFRPASEPSIRRATESTTTRAGSRSLFHTQDTRAPDSLPHPVCATRARNPAPWRFCLSSRPVGSRRLIRASAARPHIPARPHKSCSRDVGLRP
jgi:hypothetical protein